MWTNTAVRGGLTCSDVHGPAEVGHVEAINQNGYEYVCVYDTVLSAIYQLLAQPDPDDALVPAIGTCDTSPSRAIQDRPPSV